MNVPQSSTYKHSMKMERKTASLYVRNTGCQKCPPDYGWGPGVRDHFLMHHIITGKGVYICGERQFELAAGDTFLVYPDTTIHYYADKDDPWEYVWVGFSGLEAEGYMAQTDFTPEMPVLRAAGTQELHELMQGIYQSYGTRVWENLSMTASLYELVAHLIQSSKKNEQKKQDEADYAQLAAEYIVNHYAMPITVEGLAEHLAVSHSSLYRRFVKQFKVSPKRFLIGYRIERACMLLATTDYSVQSISNSVGFEDPFYFSRAFKELKGMSPRQYANQMRNRQDTNEE